MPTAFVYRRALRRFATCIVFTMFNLVVCVLMIHWVAERESFAGSTASDRAAGAYARKHVALHFERS